MLIYIILICGYHVLYMTFDNEWKDSKIVQYMLAADKEMEIRSGRISIDDSLVGNKKRNRIFLQEEYNNSIFTSIAINMEDFLMQMFFKTIDSRFKMNLAVHNTNMYVPELLQYYTEFRSLMKHAEYLFENNKINDLHTFFTTNLYKLLINYNQTMLLFYLSIDNQNS